MTESTLRPPGETPSRPGGAVRGRTLPRDLFLGLAVIGLVLLGTAGLSIASVLSAIERDRLVSQTLEVIAELEATEVILVDNETGARGFVITGDEEFLEPWRRSREEVRGHLEHLRALTADDPGQQVRLGLLEKKFQEKLRISDAHVEARRQGGFERASRMVATKEGKQAKEDVRDLVRAMVAEERDLLRGRSEAAAGSTRTTVVALSLLTVFVLGLLAAGVLYVRRDVALRRGAEAEILKLNEDLRGHAARADALAEERDRFFTLSRDLLCVAGVDGYFKRINPAWEKTLGWSEAELLAVPYLDFIHPDDHLPTVREAQGLAGGKETLQFENRYRAKDGSWHIFSWTASPDPSGRGLVYAAARDITGRRRAEEDLRRAKEDVEASNKELEAFSYSVSHDLRAPLRSIHGFVQAILEEGAGKFEGDLGDYLRRIQAAAERMGRLIDDLLSMSRLSRSEMARRPVDMGALAGDVAEALRRAEPGRQVDFRTADGALAEGDPRLLRIALENLLGNAWKFTGKLPRAAVEFGVGEEDGAPAFFVRDNGAGFDMAHAANLFSPFQRLHGQKEFAGTGIGLAIVARIVARHGGRIWAKSSPGRGATFSFTLPTDGKEGKSA